MSKRTVALLKIGVIALGVYIIYRSEAGQKLLGASGGNKASNEQVR